MRTFVFTYNRYDTLSTPMALGKIPHTVLCHSEDDKEKFLSAGRVSENSIIATGREKGLSNNRNAALDMMSDGEWAIWLVDDWIHCEQLEDYDYHSLSGVVDVNMDNQAEWRKKFQVKVPMSEFILRCEEATRECDKVGAKLAGFTSHGNVPWRGIKWKRNVFADGRAWVVKKTHLKFDENVQMMDDIMWTASNIEAFGAVLVNQWVYPKCVRYSAGGFGSLNDRMEQKFREAKYLTEKYPELLVSKKKANQPDGSHVALRRLSSKAVKW